MKRTTIVVSSPKRVRIEEGLVWNEGNVENVVRIALYTHQLLW